MPPQCRSGELHAGPDWRGDRPWRRSPHHRGDHRGKGRVFREHTARSASLCSGGVLRRPGPGRRHVRCFLEATFQADVGQSQHRGIGLGSAAMEGLRAEGGRILLDSVVAAARGHELLGKDPRIPSREHAVFIVCVALWSLREMNAVEVILSRRVRWLPYSSLMVALRTTLVSEVSIERELLNQMRMILSGHRYRPDNTV